MKSKFCLLVLSILLFVPLSVKADNRLYFEKEEIVIAPGKEKEVNIMAESDNDINKINLDVITTSTNVVFKDVTFNEGLKVTKKNGYEITSDKKIENGIIGKVTLLVKENTKENTTGHIKITNASIFSKEKIDIPNNQIKVTVLNEELNSLKSLTSKIIKLDFDKDKLEYEASVKSDVDELDLVAEAEDPNSLVDISSQKLKTGKNIINVTVTSNNNKKKVYKVVVTKEKKVNKDSNKDKIKEEKEVLEDNKNVKSGYIPVLITLSVILLIDLLVLYKKHK